MAFLKIGTCSWKFESWRGLVYSDFSMLDYLEEYAKHYNTVEIDQWFWSLHSKETISLPKPQVVKEYVSSVPEDFTFSIKVPNSITLTHFYKKSKKEPLVPNPHFLSSELFHKLLEKLGPMHKQLGPLMFQFEYLNKQKMPSLSEFLQRFETFINQCPREFTYGVEIRNPNYLNDKYFDFLQRNKLSHVFLQGYYMPPIFGVYYGVSPQVQDLTVIRLHGPNRAEIEKQSKKRWNRLLAPKDQELDALTSMLKDLFTKKVNVYLNVNNHYEGSAPLTIKRIQERLGFVAE